MPRTIFAVSNQFSGDTKEAPLQMSAISNEAATKQLIFGGLCGLCSRVALAKAGTVAASAAAGAFLVVRVAQHEGYITIDQDRVNRDIQKMKRDIKDMTARDKMSAYADNVKNFVRDNRYSAAGFACGFIAGSFIF